MIRDSILLIGSSAALVIGACGELAESPVGAVSHDPAFAVQAVHRVYGPSRKLGNGRIRTYVVLDASNRRIPLEIGVAMTAGVMENLPQPVAGSGHGMDHGPHQASASDEDNPFLRLLPMPSTNPTPFRFVELNWNPVGHEPPGIYDLPHFDFHFYTVPTSVRRSIDPSDPDYATKAGSYPAQDDRPQFYVDGATAAGVPPAMAAVPRMGMHWLDVRSPELQGAIGNPGGYQPFTKTFIYGSWDGRFIFAEPMITRAYLMDKRTATDPAVRDEIIPVPTAGFEAGGWYPTAYRITWDAREKEYRIALTGLSMRDG